jgi:Zn-dependent protease
VAAFATTLLFFASVLLHELSHSFVARRTGIGVSRITLFIFGGLAQVDDEPKTAGDELVISLAGPVASVLLAMLFGGGYFVAQSLNAPTIVIASLSRIAIANLVLAIFNMVPGYPLDGGRVLRAILWQVWGDPVRATRVASICGQVVGGALVVLGITLGVLTQVLWIAIFYVAMGLMLGSVARAGYQREVMRARLGAVAVGQVTRPPTVVVQMQGSLLAAARACLEKQYNGWVPVVDGLQPVGYLTHEQFGEVAESEWQHVPVSQVMHPLRQALVIRDRRTLGEAVQQLRSGETGGLLVLDDWGNLRGIVDRAGIEAALR